MIVLIHLKILFDEKMKNERGEMKIPPRSAL